MLTHDDEPVDLMHTSEGSEAGSGKSDEVPKLGKKLTAGLIFFAFLIPIGYLFWTSSERPGGIQIAIMVTYTFAIPWLTSNRFLKPVPWALFNRFRGRFLLVHCLALAVVYGITTAAYAAKPYLAGWFIVEGRKGSFFDLSLMAIFFVLAVWESSWILKHKDEGAPALEDH
jgi:hypothetical protein